MKRIISLLITLVLLLSFTACQKNEVDNEIAALDEFTEAEPLEKTETENSEQEEISKDNTETPAEQPSDKPQIDNPNETNPDSSITLRPTRPYRVMTYRTKQIQSRYQTLNRTLKFNLKVCQTIYLTIPLNSLRNFAT